MLLAFLENTGSPVSRTTIQYSFPACRLQRDQALREYSTLLHGYHLPLIGMPQHSSENKLAIEAYNNLP